MKKYNLSVIMKTAWNLVKITGKNMSEALKAAWAQAKDATASKGLELGTLKEKLEVICTECNKKFPGTFEIEIEKQIFTRINNRIEIEYCLAIKTIEVENSIAQRWFFGRFNENTKTYIPASTDNIFDFDTSIKSILG